MVGVSGAWVVRVSGHNRVGEWCRSAVRVSSVHEPECNRTRYAPPALCTQAHLDQYISAQEQLNASSEVVQRMEALLMAPGVEEAMAARRMYSLQVQVWGGVEAEWQNARGSIVCQRVLQGLAPRTHLPHPALYLVSSLPYPRLRGIRGIRPLSPRSCAGFSTSHS